MLLRRVDSLPKAKRKLLLGVSLSHSNSDALRSLTNRNVFQRYCVSCSVPLPQSIPLRGLDHLKITAGDVRVFSWL